MNLIKIEVFDDGLVKCEREAIGQIGEGNETKLKFMVPSSYREYFKYLDILKGNGEKTQTVIGDTESEIFYYIIPHSLTLNRELFIQLVMKREDKIFKSKMIALHFDSSILATPYLEESFQDTIEFLMENKADKSDIKDTQAKLLLKAGKSELFDLNEKLSDKLKDAQEKTDIRLEALEVITDSLRDKKVDKVYGKGLSSNDYTDEDKNKLENLPDSQALEKLLLKRPEIITYSKDEAYFDNYLSDGIYFFICEDGDVYSIETLYVWQEFDTVYQLRECKGRKTKREYYENRWSRWTEYEVPFTHADKVKLDDLEKSTRDNFEGVWLDIESIVAELIKTDEKIGDINTALDELHNYAQGLIGGDS